MIINLSTGAVNAMINSPGLAAALEANDDMELRVYSGTTPASADAAIGAATLLCVFKNGAAGITWSDAVAGGLSKPAGEVWAPMLEQKASRLFAYRGAWQTLVHSSTWTIHRSFLAWSSP